MAVDEHFNRDSEPVGLPWMSRAVCLFCESPERYSQTVYVSVWVHSIVLKSQTCNLPCTGWQKTLEVNDIETGSFQMLNPRYRVFGFRIFGVTTLMRLRPPG